MVILVLAVLVSATGTGSTPFSIPVLHTPANLEGKEIPALPQNPWIASPKTDTLASLRGLYPEDETVEVDPKLQKDLDQLSDTIQKEAQELEETKATQKQTEDNIFTEADQLHKVHAQEDSQKALYNAAASVANKLYLSEKSWQNSLSQAGKVESFVASNDNTEIRTLNNGAEVLAKAQAELDVLEQKALATADFLETDCKGPMMDWNLDATTEVNEDTRSLASIFDRVYSLTDHFDKAHNKIVDLIQTLATMQKEIVIVPDSPTKTQEPSLLQTRAKVAIQAPIKSLKGSSLAEIGFWEKLAVLKDLAEHDLGEVFTPIEVIAKKFNDA